MTSSQSKLYSEAIQVGDLCKVLGKELVVRIESINRASTGLYAYYVGSDRGVYVRSELRKATDSEVQLYY